MKKTLQFIFLFFAFALIQACEGPQGEVGPQGEIGPKGDKGATGPAGTADVYEFGQFNFNAANQYQDGLEFGPNNMDVTEGDVILVYRAAGVFEGKILWSPLPQTNIFPQGIMKYDFVHNDEFVVIFISAAFDRALLGAAWTTNQAFRFVILPGTIRNGRVAKPNIDFNNYNEVARYYNIKEEDVKKVSRK